MSAPLLELPETCRKLRQLEDAIAAQRKILGDEKRADMSADRERLAQLLHTLDRLLKDSEVTKYPPLTRQQRHASEQGLILR